MTHTDRNIYKKIDRFQLYYSDIICEDLVLKNNYTNIYQIPSLHKIVLNTTSSSYAVDKKNILPALLALELITGQKANFSCAKKSIAPFKIREKQILGCKVTLRKKQLYNFLNIFVTIVLPKLRDFSGISKKSIDPSGNLSIGFTQLLVFPQLQDHFELFQNFRGLNINFCTNKSSRLLYSAYQIPESK